MRKPPSKWPAFLASAALVLLRSAPAWAADPPSAPAATSPPRASRSFEAEALDTTGLLLLSVSLDGLTLSEGIGAYGAPDDPLVPVSELARLLEADIDVLPSERRIVGRLGQARRSLLVDLKAGVARVGAQDVAIRPEDVAVTPTEIYLRASTIQRLLPLKIEAAPDELILRLKATEAFPVQARLERMANRPAGSQPGVEQETLKVTQPYAFFSPPGFDLVLDGGLQSGKHDTPFRYDVRAAGDLLWANFQGFLGSDEEGRATNARVLLQRRSLEGDLLGPLHAREVTAGDTYTPGLAMGPRSVAGRGISFSTAPLEQTNIFNRIDLRGELPPGYDVELYVNDVLKSSTNQAVQGRYEFLDVPLSPGLNVLRVVTYSPRGERNEEVQVVNVGAALLRPGEAQLQVGIVEQDHPVIRLRHLDAVSIGESELFADHGLRAVASLNFGVTDLLTFTAGAARTPRASGGGHTGIYTIGARTSLGGVATQLDSAWDGRGGQGVSLGLAGQYGGVSAVLRHAEYRDNFVDENNLGFNPRLEMQRRSELTLDSSLHLRGRIVPVSMRVIRNEYKAGDNDILAAGRASSSLGKVLISLGMEYRRQAYHPSPANETLSGYIAASTFRSYRWQIRSTFDYDILPDFRARFLSVTVDRRINDTWSLRFGLGQPLDKFDSWNVLASSIYATPLGDLAITGEYDNTDRDWRLSAQWNFGLGYDPERRGYSVTRTGPGSGGSVLFNAFIDENGDGVRQASEVAAPNVAVDGGMQHGIVTGPDGRVLITGLGAGPTAHLDVSLDKLENSAVSTPPSRLELRPRPGGVSRIDYPMRPTGGVMVKVELLRDNGKRVGLSSVRIQLAALGGQPVESVTEFDGSAVFDAVPTGTYRLQLEPHQADKLRMRLLQQPTVVIKGNGDFAPDVVVQVRFDPAPPETTVAKVGGG